jgi:putative mycofactocin binding protein MftB
VTTATATDQVGFDLDRAWQLHPQVSVRPERFGALLYHFGTRRLSFLKSTTLRDIVTSLAEQPSARAAVLSCDVPADQQLTYAKALKGLADSQMICPQEAP